MPLPWSAATTDAATSHTAANASRGSGRGRGSNSSGDEFDGTSKNTTQKASPPSSSPGTPSQVRYGKCKWFNVAKGWGFLTPNDGGQEVFVHQSVIQMNGFRSLGEQEEVEFECQETERGLEATRVSGRQGNDCNGSTFRPRAKRRPRRVRCYNCGEFANHIASKCQLGPLPKRCHLCKQEDHLFQSCPMRNTQTSSLDDDSKAPGSPSTST